MAKAIVTTPPAPLQASPARTTLLLGGTLLALAAAVLLSLTVGSKPTTVAQVWAAVTGTADPYTTTVVASRYPRTILGILAGAALAAAGLLLQGITRNPLADPGLLGVNAGAMAAVVTAIALLGPTSTTATVWWALPGALLAGLVAYLLGGRESTGSTVRLVLAGAVISAVLTAYVQAVALSMPHVFDNYRYWVVGSLAGRGFDVIASVLPFLTAGALLALLLSSSLNTLALGEETATALGANPFLIRSGGLAAATLLAAGATAATGPIAFVGLAVPHVVRALIGGDFRTCMPLALLAGPTLLLLADVLGRFLLRPAELMVGVVTAFVGAPFLFHAVRRMRGPS